MKNKEYKSTNYQNCCGLGGVPGLLNPGTPVVLSLDFNTWNEQTKF